MEKKALVRDASTALRPAAGAAGSACPPAARVRALAITTRWLGQITMNTFMNMTRASRMPVEMAMPGAVLK